MKRTVIKVLLVLAQIMPIIFLLELSFLRSMWTFPIAFILIAVLIPVKCRSCGTHLGDESIVGKWIPVRPAVVDRCSVCGRPMA